MYYLLGSWWWNKQNQIWQIKMKKKISSQNPTGFTLHIKYHIWIGSVWVYLTVKGMEKPLRMFLCLQHYSVWLVWLVQILEELPSSIASEVCLSIVSPAFTHTGTRQTILKVFLNSASP